LTREAGQGNTGFRKGKRGERKASPKKVEARRQEQEAIERRLQAEKRKHEKIKKEGREEKRRQAHREGKR